MSAEPQIAQRAAQAYAGLPLTVTMDSFPAAIDAGFPELFGTLGQQGIAPAGPPLIRYHVIDMEGEMEVELGVPVAGEFTGAGRVRPGVVPGGRYVTLLHTGPYDGLMAANAALQDWAAQQGITLASSPDHRSWPGRVEYYLTDPSAEPDPANVADRGRLPDQRIAGPRAHRPNSSANRSTIMSRPLSSATSSAADQLVLARALARAAGRADGHDDAGRVRLVGGERAAALDERPDVAGHHGGLAARGAGHLVVGAGDVAQGEDPVLAGHLEELVDRDEPVGVPGGGQRPGQVVADRGDPVAAEPHVAR